MKNRNSTVEIWKSAFPIKKVFANDDRFIIDDKTLEGYGREPNKKFETLQKWLSMPLNMSPSNLLNLPYKVSGSNSRQPYLIIYGTYESTKTKNPTIKLNLQSKDQNEFTAELDLNSKKRIINASGTIITKIDKENYKIGENLLIDEYKKTKIIDKNETLSSLTFKKIIDTFFEFVLSKSFEDFKTKPLRFGLVVLPSKEQIHYLTKQEENKTAQFTDAFNSKSNSYGDKPTQTAKFMSFDDPAFAINCTEKEEFYKNLSINHESLQKINIVMDEVINISGLSWLFLKIDQPELKFEKMGSGIYDQMFYNYQKTVEKAGDSLNRQSQMKIICFKTTQAKIEVLIDENITMQHLQRTLNRAKEKKPFSGALEHLIQMDDKGKTTLWNNYLYAVRTFVLGNFMEREKLLQILTSMLKKELFKKYLKNIYDAKEFFTKSEFCINLLCKTGGINESMNNNEQFAYGIGKIAGAYIKFKHDVNEDNNSLSDIMTYSKYDREKLRFVLQRIGLGIHLSKANENKKQLISNFVSQTQQSKEISESDAANDYSYFFYKGAFEKLE